MASASSLAEWPNLIRKIFLTQTKNTAGIFGVTFFVRGKPHVISVDDNLYFWNTINTGTDYGGGGPYFAHLSKDNRTIWGAVLEKAAAKLKGNYYSMYGSSSKNGIKSLTGAPVIWFENR